MEDSKINCWEYLKCGREPGGAKADELGVCKAAVDESFDGINGGVCGGRVCWAVAGTLCGGQTQGTFAQKRKTCVKCDFFKQIHKDEERAPGEKGIIRDVEIEKKERIQTKLFKIFIPSIILIFAVVGGMSVFFQSSALRDELEKKADLSVKIAVGILEKSLWDFDEDHLRQMCDVMAEDSEIAAVAAFDEGGAALYQSGDKGVLANLESPGAVKGVFSREQDIIWRPTDERIGKVRIYFSRLPTARKQQKAILFYFLTMVVLITSIIVITRIFFKKIIFSPLNYLLGGIQRITSEKIYHPVEVMARDEIGHLTISFNEMMKRINDYAHNLEKKVEERTREIIEKNRIIQEEQEKSEKLLLNILPAAVADDLKRYGKTEPRFYKNVTVFFSDVVGFTKLSSTLKPKSLIGELNRMFTFFDQTIKKNGCERIKTIGDAYLAVCGMHRENERHAENIVRSALRIIEWLKESGASSGMKWQIRIGIHSGEVAGGIVGTEKYIYDVFGDAINTASRMESHSEPMKINISEATHLLVRDKFVCVERGAAPIKGKGEMKMYFVESERTV
ncbi:hypothetical protein EPICR_100009 [Candidatus Desulfarcum epimagneticum]|uniref:Adenylate cyclase n=1 Tax=uncultured Desulfobacteraceae bacterium TaxID=218296 RepID=A0A484HEQ0_9BACT|nr:hypothetical protein EPICR_100009 [uncultured Desulfobacteraceae bacterium]